MGSFNPSLQFNGHNRSFEISAHTAEPMIANNDPNYQQDSNSPHTKPLARRTLRLVIAEVMFYEQNELTSIP